MEGVAGPWVIVSLFTIGAVVFVQLLFWVPSSTGTGPQNANVVVDPSTRNEDNEITIDSKSNITVGNSLLMPIKATTMTTNDVLPATRYSTSTLNSDADSIPLTVPWRCVCEKGFLPPGMLKSFSSAEAVVRLGTGQCYHKQM